MAAVLIWHMCGRLNHEICIMQALCINDSVQRLANATRINEKCLDLQSSKGRKKVVIQELGSTKASSKPQSGCPFRKAHMTSQRQLKVSSQTSWTWQGASI